MMVKSFEILARGQQRVHCIFACLSRHALEALDEQAARVLRRTLLLGLVGVGEVEVLHLRQHHLEQVAVVGVLLRLLFRLGHGCLLGGDGRKASSAPSKRAKCGEAAAGPASVRCRASCSHAPRAA
jgi:hypothetical protein